MSLFVIDLEENIMEKDSKLSFTLKPCLKKPASILSFISKRNIISCKKDLQGQELSNFSKSFIFDEP